MVTKEMLFKENAELKERIRELVESHLTIKNDICEILGMGSDNYYSYNKKGWNHILFEIGRIYADAKRNVEVEYNNIEFERLKNMQEYYRENVSFEVKSKSN